MPDNIAPTTPNLADIPPGITIDPNPAAAADTGAALDALFKPFDEPAAPTPEPVVPAASTPPVEPKPDAGATPPEIRPGVPALPALPVTPAAAAPPVTPVAPVTPDPTKDEYDAVQLPPHTKSEVATSFETLKKTSREVKAALLKEKEELATRVKELETRPAVDPKLEAELKELREFRAKMDVEADPTFKEYFETAAANDNSIWNKLKEAGANEETLTKMKAIGTKDLDWEIILEKLPPVSRRYVENKLAVNEDLRDQRARAIETAKANASEFLAEREKVQTQDELTHYAKAEEHFNKVAPQLPWYKLQKAAADATPEQKAAIEAENKFYLATHDQVTRMLKDNSPAMRSIAALGYAQMLRLQEEIPLLQAEHAADTKGLRDEVAKLTATIKERDDYIARLKGASRTVLREGGAPAPGGAAAQPTFNEPGTVAIDRLRSQQLAGS